MANNASDCIRMMQDEINRLRAENERALVQIKQVTEGAEHALNEARNVLCERTAIISILLSRYCDGGTAVIGADEIAHTAEQIDGGRDGYRVDLNLSDDYILRANGR